MDIVLTIVAVGVLVAIVVLASRKGFMESYRQAKYAPGPQAAKPESGPMPTPYPVTGTVGVVVCAECGKAIHTTEGGLFQQVPDLEQWFGNVCVQCDRVYCDQCLAPGGPTPCPHCGSPTKPAQRGFLRQIGKEPQ